MKVFVSIAAFVAGVLSQSTFEPSDFNITEALLDNGVNISAIPELAPLVERSLISGCSLACRSLKFIFGDDLVETQTEPTYNAFVNSFWSAQQREITPQCIFKPEKALDVSTTVLISRLTQCPFAAKSGGHSAVPGGSNVDGGITISFEKMSKIALSADKKIASFQPGHTWFDIYTALEAENLAVVGGRVSSVGVGGLTLGGGISYFSSVYGLACDNVESYELVTASGPIITVSETEFPDLYWALRGGGNNFGIVTQFNVATIPRAPTMWGGMRSYLAPSFPALINAFYNLGVNAKIDGKAHQILSFAWAGLQVAQLELEYADPIPDAPILAEYNAVPGAVADQTAVRSLAQLTTALAGPASGPGLRQAFWTWTVKLDKEMATLAKDIFFEELPSIVNATNLIPAVSLQVLTEPLLEKTATKGGNTLGLDAKDGPLLLALVAIKWSNSADDDRINRFAARVKDRALAAATAQGKASPYLYMNYGSPYQNVVAGYGPENQARLKAISEKYDPTNVFERLQPGYFKLDGAPWGNGP
ncbi:FAD-binding domain-containing protein [Cucurbitaria berberidis CBS 394.84]|uniref:FAD-binding domain-containing protein n=1 Tax=Cucurbitaria berberidis CBS 394.84 TaxID=1168544 RepID=A0A9P4GM79_9PLEO|nr:FAD-binding domain-containing protein [Cucurbitaria berberidis CBS 394.84]KAF1847782.1 FAD-binding domain-containing protein [Cucurbitaria berberidis CBS 394.84]